MFFVDRGTIQTVSSIVFMCTNKKLYITFDDLTKGRGELQLIVDATGKFHSLSFSFFKKTTDPKRMGECEKPSHFHIRLANGQLEIDYFITMELQITLNLMQNDFLKNIELLFKSYHKIFDPEIANGRKGGVLVEKFFINLHTVIQTIAEHEVTKQLQAKKKMVGIQEFINESLQDIATTLAQFELDSRSVFRKVEKQKAHASEHKELNLPPPYLSEDQLEQETSEDAVAKQSISYP